MISRYQQYLGHFPAHVNFLEVVARKFFKRDIDRLQVVFFDFTLAVIPVSAAAVRFVVS